MLITTKGQVTVPQPIRNQFGLLPHTEVEFVVKNQEVILRKAVSPQKNIIKKALRSMVGKAEIRLSTDEIMKLTRG